MLTDRTPFICKFADGDVVHFLPRSITQESHLDGILSKRMMDSAKTRNITVMFHCGKDRYFLNTRLVRVPGGWRLKNCGDFYRLNRRGSFRVLIPASIQLSFNIISASDELCMTTARLVEFSAGGAQIRWPGNTQGIRKGSLLKGNLIWFRGKSVPVTAEVKHQMKPGIFGISFLFADSVQANRLKLMSIELQQMVNFL